MAPFASNPLNIFNFVAGTRGILQVWRVDTSQSMWKPLHVSKLMCYSPYLTVEHVHESCGRDALQTISGQSLLRGELEVLGYNSPKTTNFFRDSTAGSPKAPLIIKLLSVTDSISTSTWSAWRVRLFMVVMVVHLVKQWNMLKWNLYDTFAMEILAICIYIYIQAMIISIWLGFLCNVPPCTVHHIHMTFIHIHHYINQLNNQDQLLTAHCQSTFQPWKRLTSIWTWRYLGFNSHQSRKFQDSHPGLFETF